MRNAARIHAVIVLIFLALRVAPMAYATVGLPGTLDPLFAAGSPLGSGKVITPINPPFTNRPDTTYAMALQPDGKLVLVGSCISVLLEFCTLRYNADGTPDMTFGSAGIVITPILGRGDIARAVAVLPDGKLVLAGYCLNGGLSNDFCALRYHSNGVLDLSFGVDGKVVTTAFGSDAAYALAAQPDGKLVLAGGCSGGFCAVRYNANGSPDTSFGTAGRVVTPVGLGGGGVAAAVAVQSDGKLVLAGTCSNGSNNDFCALRYNADGSLHSAFGTAGTVITSVGAGNDAASALAVQPDGKLALAGTCSNGSNNDFCALRYNANGSLDATFGTAGTVITPVGLGNDAASALALQSDGKLVLAGTCNNGVNDDFCALRYNANGTLDTSLGSTGKVITPVGVGNDAASAVVIQPDGKLVLVGVCSSGSKDNFCALRYDGGPFGYRACTLDIDGDGSVLATTDSLIHARVALGMTGNAVVNGITFPATATRNTWPLIREYLVTQCGMSLVP